eukprot:TRINITY_DN11038_c0_g1_i1.p1 TRINITY_DN11038_c0_g1~~TRINITY_DN11038_c0_g1_i1.p1  ORF type:complete len:262 (+),score=100.62 TRINITY_DN11038_c0_g1_i1:53-838(+)
MSRLVVVTGANRGFGRAVALAAAKRWPQATLLLSHRAKSVGMNDTEKLVREASSEAHVLRWELDLADGVQEIEANTRARLGEVVEGFGEVVFVHNAASLGPMKKGEELGAVEIASAFHANVTACAVVHSTLLTVMAAQAEVKLTVINVSSLCALQPFPGFELYCAGKAARNMMLRVSKEEYAQHTFLNYAPGPMDTDMAGEIRDEHYDAATRRQFQELKDKADIVCPYASARRLVWLLATDGAFESGAHVDYFDITDSAAA